MTAASERIVVIGGGIAGLASAALLARDGHRVTLLEARGELGGRAGTWERDGFRFDTGPSWYLMPEVFDHFFRLFGTSAAEQLELTRLDPGYRVYADGYDAPRSTCGASRAENVALFESVEPGAGAALERYLDSAASTYDIARRRFLYTNFDDPRAFARARGARRCGAPRPPARHAARPLRRARRARPPPAAGARLPGGVPRVLAVRAPAMYHLMSHMDLEEGVLLPAGRVRRAHRAHRRDRARRRASSVITNATGRGDRADRTTRPPSVDRRALPGPERRDRTRRRRTSSCRRPTCTTPRPNCCRAGRADLSRAVVGPQARRAPGRCW